MFCLLCFCSVLSLDEKFFYKEMMVKVIMIFWLYFVLRLLIFGDYINHLKM